MSNPDGETSKQYAGVSSPTAPPAATADAENQSSETSKQYVESAAEVPSPITPPAASGDVENQSFGVSAIRRRWRREDLLMKVCLGLRALALILSLITLIITASNKHGYGRNFDEYEEYRYLLAIAILSTLYTAAQLRHFYELSTGKHPLQKRTSAVVDFVGDQIMAYLLISAASSAVPLTNRMREGADNIFTDASASAISMAFFAFLSLALSAVVCGYKLSTQSYI